MGVKGWQRVGGLEGKGKDREVKERPTEELEKLRAVCIRRTNVDNIIMSYIYKNKSLWLVILWAIMLITH